MGRKSVCGSNGKCANLFNATLETCGNNGKDEEAKGTCSKFGDDYDARCDAPKCSEFSTSACPMECVVEDDLCVSCEDYPNGSCPVGCVKGENEDEKCILAWKDKKTKEPVEVNVCNAGGRSKLRPQSCEDCNNAILKNGEKCKYYINENGKAGCNALKSGGTFKDTDRITECDDPRLVD